MVYFNFCFLLNFYGEFIKNNLFLLDIINGIFMVTSFYKKANSILKNSANSENNEFKYCSLEIILSKEGKIELEEFIPNFSLEKVSNFCFSSIRRNLLF